MTNPDANTDAHHSSVGMLDGDKDAKTISEHGETYIMRQAVRSLTLIISCLLTWWGMIATGNHHRMGFGITESVTRSARLVSLNGLTIGIDELTGGLVFLSYPAIGAILQIPPKSAGPLEVAQPIESFLALRRATRFSRARVNEQPNKVTIDWDELGPSRTDLTLPDGKVSAQLEIRAADDGRSVILSCRVDNNTNEKIPQIFFPDLRGLKPFGGCDQTELRFMRGSVKPFLQELKPPHSAAFYAARDYAPRFEAIGVERYGSNHGLVEPMVLRWLDFGSLQSGLSIFQKRFDGSRQPDVYTQRTESDPMTLRLIWEHQVTIEPHQSWTSDEFWLTPHSGGWAKGIETYRKYVHSVNPPREFPRHVRAGLGFQTIWMTQSLEYDPERAAFRFSDLPEVARDAKEHGIDELNIWFWCQYFALPIHVKKELGTREEFLSAIQQAKRLGVNISPFVSITNINKEQAIHFGAKKNETLHYTYDPELFPMFSPYYANFYGDSVVDHENRVWQEESLASLKEWIDLGMSSLSWDAFSVQSQKGKKPGLMRLAEELRKAALARDPQSVFSAEVDGNYEWICRVADYSWNWEDYVDYAPLLNVFPLPRLNCNVEDSPLVVKKAFCDGLYINAFPKKPDLPNGSCLIGDVPVLSAALKEVAALRKQFLDSFLRGTFIGSSVLSAPTTGFVRAYQLDKKLLVIVLNDQLKSQHVTVQSNLKLWLPPARSYEIKSYDHTGSLLETVVSEENKWHAATRLLQPLQLAFFELESD